MERRKVFAFGLEDHDSFRLELCLSGEGRKVLRLLRGSKVVKGLSDQTLEVLQYLLERTGRVCERADVLLAISPDSDNNLIDRYVCYLREAFADSDDEKRQFIETVATKGYRFLLPVKEEGNVDSLNAYDRWDKVHFHQLLRDLTRNGDEDEDLRIITTGISPSIEVLDLDGLLQRKLRIKILFMNPKNEGLTAARYGLRKDRDAERCLRELNEQIADISQYAELHPPIQGSEHEPSLEYRVSDTMPSGFVVHTARWAIMGIFLAHSSYTAGPMFEMRSGTEAWKQLQLDWKARWKAAINPNPDQAEGASTNQVEA